MKKTYLELIDIPTYDERLKYCMLFGHVGDPTFGNDRWINQVLYSSEEWRRFRREIALRDNGCDLALAGFDIYKYGVVHHLNPISKEDILERNPKVFDPNNVVLVSSDTHRAIHYGVQLKQPELVVRYPGDTCPWKKEVVGHEHSRRY